MNQNQINNDLNQIVDILENGSISVTSGGNSTIITDISLNSQTSDVNTNITNSSIPVTISGTLPSNLTQLNSNTIDLGSGNIDVGTQRICIADNQASVNVVLNEIGSGPNVVSTNSGNTDSGCQRIVLGNTQPTLNVSSSTLAVESGGNLDRIFTSSDSIDGKLVKGVNTAANSLCVNIASDQILDVSLNNLSRDSGNTDSGTLRVITSDDNPDIPVVNGLTTFFIKETITDRIPLTMYLKNGSSKDLSVNGSSTNVSYRYTVPSNRQCYIEFLKIILLDNEVQDLNNFGNINNGLTNGLLIRYRTTSGDSDNYLYDTDNNPITNNYEFDAIGEWNKFDVEDNPEYRKIVCNFEKSPIIMNAGGYIEIIVRDNITGLNYMSAQVKGYLLAV